MPRKRYQRSSNQRGRELERRRQKRLKRPAFNGRGTSENAWFQIAALLVAIGAAYVLADII